MTDEERINAFTYELGKLDKKDRAKFLASVELVILIGKMGEHHLAKRYPYYNLGKEAVQALNKQPKPKKSIVSKKRRNQEQ